MVVMLVLLLGRVYCDVTLPDYVNYLTKMAEGIDKYGALIPGTNKPLPHDYPL